MASLNPAREEDAATESDELSDEAAEEENERQHEDESEEEEEQGNEGLPRFIELPANIFSISMEEVASDAQIAQLVQVLRTNVDVRNIWFQCREQRPPRVGQVPGLDWGPLFREIETLQRLEKVALLNHDPMPLFHQGLFQAFQRNANLRSLCLTAENTEDVFIPFLDAATNLKELELCNTVASVTMGNDIAAALQRNTNIERLCLNMCCDKLVRPIFQKLASPESTSRLAKLSYGHRIGLPVALVAEAIQHYLQSTGATIQCLELVHFHAYDAGFEGVLDSLATNTSVKEVEFRVCSAQSTAPGAHILANFIRNKVNLSTLRVQSCDFLQYPVVVDALVEVLVHPESLLRCFGFDIDYAISLDGLQALMAAFANSRIRLERLFIDEIRCNDDRFQHLLNAFPSFKVKDITLSMTSPDEEEERLLAAVKANYIVQRVYFKSPNNEDASLSEAGQTRLNAYLERNRKLAQWTQNPETVPRELWQYAMMLAMKAGANTLLESLLALSGQGVGLKQRGRKQKRPQYYQP